MNRNKFRFITATIVGIIVAISMFTPQIATDVVNNDKNTTSTVEEQTNTTTDEQTNATTSNTDKNQNSSVSDLYTPSQWNEDESPDFYKIEGEANIFVSDLAPSEVRYTYDKHARTQSVHALLTYENIEYGQRERESISDIEPIGWPYNNGRESVTFRDGKTYNGWFWNRSHLLGHAIGGADEEKNLITGTRAQNVGKNDMHGGMQFTETLVRDYFETNKNGSVYYLVTPVYEENENIPRSVFVDIKSKDESIDMHVEIFNVMPDCEINYKNGTWEKR